MFSFSAIRFDLNRINPISGMKRLFDKHALVRLGLAAAKLAILALLSWQVVGSRVPAMVASSGSSAGAIAATCLSALFQLGLTITVLLAVVALADFVVQRRWAAQSIRMTKQEVRQEWKEQEGDPLIRSQRRRRARQLAFARMMDAIPTADVVVTNPTTLAVALKYDSLTMRAPKIVAKGQRLMAERIKQIARKNRVPVIEDKPLARALFSRPIGAEVPTHLYRAVARLLVLVHQARFRVAGRSAARASAPVWAMAGASAGGSARPWWADASASVGSPIAEDEEAARRGRVIEGVATGQSEDAISDRPVARVRRLDEIDDDSVIDVEDEELMQSIADEELTDVSAEELAELDAGQVDESDARWDTPANRGPNDEESPR
jgi:type III secretion system FlhB-like substrate exporter